MIDAYRVIAQGNLRPHGTPTPFWLNDACSFGQSQFGAALGSDRLGMVGVRADMVAIRQTIDVITHTYCISNEPRSSSSGLWRYNRSREGQGEGHAPSPRP